MTFRREWEGEISMKYKVPKYAKLFLEFLIKNKIDTIQTSVLELGAGDRDITNEIQKKGHFITYISTDLKDGYDAENLDFANNSFDIVICFDLLHHCNHPQKAAQEMLRVSRKWIFIIEANGMCQIRKLLENTKKYEEAGENSYYPSEYIEMFGNNFKVTEEKPFLFMIPHLPMLLSPLNILISELLEKIPIIKWQGSSILIGGYKNVKKKNFA